MQKLAMNREKKELLHKIDAHKANAALLGSAPLSDPRVQSFLKNDAELDNMIRDYNERRRNYSLGSTNSNAKSIHRSINNRGEFQRYMNDYANASYEDRMANTDRDVRMWLSKKFGPKDDFTEARRQFGKGGYLRTHEKNDFFKEKQRIERGVNKRDNHSLSPEDIRSWHEYVYGDDKIKANPKDVYETLKNGKSDDVAKRLANYLADGTPKNKAKTMKELTQNEHNLAPILGMGLGIGTAAALAYGGVKAHEAYKKYKKRKKEERKMDKIANMEERLMEKEARPLFFNPAYRGDRAGLKLRQKAALSALNSKHLDKKNKYSAQLDSMLGNWMSGIDTRDGETFSNEYNKLDAEANKYFAVSKAERKAMKKKHKDELRDLKRKWRAK